MGLKNSLCTARFALGRKTLIQAAQKISSRQQAGVVGAIVEYEDQKRALKEAGVEHVFNAYAEAGIGFAEHVCGLISEKGIKV